jgi:hypothetical protein
MTPLQIVSGRRADGKVLILIFVGCPEVVENDMPLDTNPSIKTVAYFVIVEMFILTVYQTWTLKSQGRAWTA